MYSLCIALTCALVGCGRMGFDANTRDATSDAHLVTTPRHWVQRTPTTSPPRLRDINLVYHPVRRTVLAYGGRSNQLGRNLDELWEYDGTTWTGLCSPCSPGERSAYAMTYDPIRDRVLVYGGDDTAFGILGDLWEWDGILWQQKPVAGPPPLTHATFVWDPVGQRALLIGGYGVGRVYPTDIWSYDGTTWTAIPSNAPPLESTGPHAVWDAAADQLVAYGSPIDDARDTTWTWSGGSFTERCTGCSGIERVAASLVYAPGTGVLLVGGFIPATDEIEGTWLLSGTSFQQVETDPTPRDSQGLTYDPDRDVVVMFGGNGCNDDDCDETWEYVPD